LNWLLVLPIALPLAVAAVTAAARERLTVARVASLGSALVVLGCAVALVWATRDGDVLVAGMGGWPPRFRIALVADPFAALMLTVTALMIAAGVVFAAARREDEQPYFHSLLQVLFAGACGAYLTADVFDLFVFVEVALIASYVLLTMGGTIASLRAGAVYVTTNLLASTAFVAGIALLYATAGTVNFAELVGRARETGQVAVAGSFILAALAVKAGLVPVHGWLPRSYPLASPAVTAVFSGILTKVGVYAIFRLYSTLFQGDPTLRTPLLVVASLTMVLGVLGAVGKGRMRDILSFHMVSQVGYLVLALGISGVAGLSAGIFFMIQYIVVKTSLFLCAGAVETFEGTGALDELGALARRRPVLAAAFGVSALSLAGVPPLSGFFAKLAVLQAAFAAGDYAVGGVAVGVSFLTLLSMVKIWNGVFWGDRPSERQGPPSTPTGVRAAALVAPAAALAALSIALGLGAQVLWSLSERAAALLVDQAAYVEAVLR
jgi:multicomponent Na+:H+ antiporter subunit D